MLVVFADILQLTRLSSIPRATQYATIASWIKNGSLAPYSVLRNSVPQSIQMDWYNYRFWRGSATPHQARGRALLSPAQPACSARI